MIILGGNLSLLGGNWSLLGSIVTLGWPLTISNPPRNLGMGRTPRPPPPFLAIQELILCLVYLYLYLHSVEVDIDQFVVPIDNIVNQIYSWFGVIVTWWYLDYFQIVHIVEVDIDNGVTVGKPRWSLGPIGLQRCWSAGANNANNTPHGNCWEHLWSFSQKIWIQGVTVLCHRSEFTISIQTNQKLD